MNTSLFSRSTKMTCAATIVAGCLLLTNAAPGAAKDRRVDLKWSELGQAVIGRKVTMVLPDGESIEGKVQDVGSDELIVDAKKSSNKSKYALGRCAIPRSSISVLHLGEVRGKWRVLGTVIGAGAGVAIGSAFYTYANNEAAPDLGAKVAAGVITGGAGLGYLAGRAIDHHALIINVVK